MGVGRAPTSGALGSGKTPGEGGSQIHSAGLSTQERGERDQLILCYYCLPASSIHVPFHQGNTLPALTEVLRRPCCPPTPCPPAPTLHTELCSVLVHDWCISDTIFVGYDRHSMQLSQLSQGPPGSRGGLPLHSVTGHLACVFPPVFLNGQNP